VFLPNGRNLRECAAISTKYKPARRVGLARALSKLGYCSRSRASELIRQGRVTLNGRPRCDPETPVNLPADHIAVDGKWVAAGERLYLVLNKPRGLVTTASDERGRKTVYAFLDPDTPFVAPVGRLDKASEGLLILTNDSEWSARILAPETHLDKTYHVQIARVADAALVQALIQGVRMNDGDLLRAKEALIVREGRRNTWLEVVLDEGKNRHIRRMFDQLGVEVLRLVRVAIGPQTLGDLAKGAVRQLTDAEKRALDRAMDRAREKGSFR
jgi:23S rRNA pseudouridine2605 synthase